LINSEEVKTYTRSNEQFTNDNSQKIELFTTFLIRLAELEPEPQGEESFKEAGTVLRCGSGSDSALYQMNLTKPLILFN
jgi:hypothetical protein